MIMAHVFTMNNTHEEFMIGELILNEAPTFNFFFREIFKEFIAVKASLNRQWGAHPTKCEHC